MGATTVLNCVLGLEGLCVVGVEVDDAGNGLTWRVTSPAKDADNPRLRSDRPMPRTPPRISSRVRISGQSPVTRTGDNIPGSSAPGAISHNQSQ